MAQMFYVSREWKQIFASMYTKHVSDIISTIIPIKRI